MGAPNIKPITAIVILSSIFIYIREGATIGALTMLLTGVLMGVGLWTPLQMLSYIIIAFGVKLLSKKNIYILVAYGFISSFIYGFITNFSMLPYIENSSLIAVWISGIAFDLTHAISTSIFILILYSPFRRIFKLS